MKWIKASERLPEKVGGYVIKHYNGYCLIAEFAFFNDGKGRFHQSNHFIKDANKCEWLDESDGWISVEDRLPELTEPLMTYDDELKEMVVFVENYEATVLAYNEELGVFKASLKKHGWSEISSLSIKGGVKPTHWQPLPSNPINK